MVTYISLLVTFPINLSLYIYVGLPVKLFSTVRCFKNILSTVQITTSNILCIRTEGLTNIQHDNHIGNERTLTLVGGAGEIRQKAAWLPRSVVVERKALLARVTGRVVLAHAR